MSNPVVVSFVIRRLGVLSIFSFSNHKSRRSGKLSTGSLQVLLNWGQIFLTEFKT